MDNKYLTKAKRLITLSKEEVKNIKKDDLYLRNASDKVWLAVIHTAKALFIKCGVREENLPNSNRGLFVLMRKFGTRDMRKKFNAFYSCYHIRGFHDGELDISEFNELLPDVEEFIKEIERFESKVQ